MARDPYTAVWVSHSSISDFLQCPRAYYLRNVHKDPKTGHKVALIKPAMALGQAVHEVIDSLSLLPQPERFKKPLEERLAAVWEKLSGKKGGFGNREEEARYQARAKAMLDRITQNPGPLSNLAVKLKTDFRMNLPQFWLSDEENIILCGTIDWLEYLPATDSVHIIDFKTGKAEEDQESLQLPIYYLLVKNCQEREISKLSYWYLEHDNQPVEQSLPDLEDSRRKVLRIAEKIKLARQLDDFLCPRAGGCYACQPFEAVIRGEAEFVGVNDRRRDVYIE